MAEAQVTVQKGILKENKGAACYRLGVDLVVSGVASVDPMPGEEEVTSLSGGNEYPIGMSFYRVEADGARFLLDTISNGVADKGCSPNGYINKANEGSRIEYAFAGSQVYASTGNRVSRTARIKTVTILPRKFEWDELGKTYMLRLYMYNQYNSPSRIVELYFDVVGPGREGYIFLDDVSGAYKGFADDWLHLPCPGSGPVEMKIGNQEYPYGETLVSYLGYKYSVSYEWQRTYDSWSRPIGKVASGDTYVDNEVASFKQSGYVLYSINSTIFRNGTQVDNCQLDLSPSTYNVTLYSPLQLKNDFENITSGATDSGDKFTVCYGDDVKYTPTFIQELETEAEHKCIDGEVFWKIERLDDEGNVDEVMLDEDFYYQDQYFEFSNLTQTATYRVTCEYIDEWGNSIGYIRHFGDDYGDHIDDPNPCPTVKTFTIEVRQLPQGIRYSYDSRVCAEGANYLDAAIRNIESSDSPKDYAYRWMYSDDEKATFKPLSSPDYTVYGDPDWVDPVDPNSVEFNYVNINYPFLDGTDDGKDYGPRPKWIKFQAANTYVINGTRYFCPEERDFSFLVYKLPLLKPVPDVFACKGQKVAFQVLLDESVKRTSPESGDGMTYEVFTDEDCTVKATNVVNLDGTLNPDDILSQGDEWTNWSRINEGNDEDTYAWFGLQELDKDSYTFFVRVKNEETGCYSHPVKVQIFARPLPDIVNLVAVPDSYCQNDDATALEATANLTDDFDNFYAAHPELPKPDVTYHWIWSDAAATQVGSAEILNSNVLNSAAASPATFDGLTDIVGNANVKVWATSSDGCGYELDYNGNEVGATVMPARQTTVKINDLPYFEIETGVQACADQGSVKVKLSSLDARELGFSFTSKTVDGITAPGAINPLVNVPGNGSAYFETTVNTADVTDVTVYSYDVIVTDNTSLHCSDNGTLSFTAYPIPVLELLPALDDRHVCQDASIKLNVNPSTTENKKSGAAARYSYEWKIDGATVANTKEYLWNTTRSTTSGIHNVSVTVTYTFSDGHTCSTTGDFEVFVDALPQLSFVSDVTICEGDNVTITGSVTNNTDPNHLGVPNTFTPSVTGGTVNSTSDVDDHTWDFDVSPTNTTTYYLSVTNSATGCAVPANEESLTVTVNRKARIRLDNLSENQVCEGVNTITIDYTVLNPEEIGYVDLAKLYVDGFTILSTSGSQIVVQADLTPGLIDFSALTMVAYTDKGCGVEFTNSLTLKVNDIPDAPTVKRTPDGDNEVCYHANKVFTFNPTEGGQSGYRYEFFESDTKPAVTATPNGTGMWPNARYSVNGVNLENSIKIWVRVVDTNNPTACASEFAGPFDIIVNKTPKPTCPDPATICEGETATLTVTAPLSEATKTFTYDFFLGSTSVQKSHEVSYTTSPLTSTTTYYVQTIWDETGCTSEKVAVNVTVHKKPVGSTKVNYLDADDNATVTLPDLSVVTPTAFCKDQEGKALVNLSANLQNPTDPITSTLVDVSVGSLSDWVKVSETLYTCKKVWDQDVTLTFTVNDGSCTSDPFTAVVKVIDPPAAPSLKISINEICKRDNKSIQLSVLPYAGKTSDINFVFYMHKKGETAILAGPFTTTTGSITKKTIDGLAIDEDVDFTAYAYNKKTGCMSAVSNIETLIVHPLPVPTVIASPAVLCPNETTTLSVAETYNAYEWLDHDTKGKTTQSVDATVPATRTYTVKVTDLHGCVSDPGSVTVTVHPVPEFTVSVAPDAVCQGSDDRVEFTLTPLNDDQVDFQYPYVFRTEAPSTKTIQTTTDVHGNTVYFVDGEEWNESSVQFWFKVYSTSAYNSCVSEELPVTVNVIPALAQPIVYAVSPQDGSDTRDVHVCKGSTEPVSVSIHNVPAYPTADGTTYSYHWYSDAAGTVELVNGVDYTITPDGKLSFVATDNISLYVKVIRESAPKCESPISEVVTVTIENLPNAPVANAPTIYICQPENESDNLNLTVQSPASDYIYHWYRQNDGEFDDDMTDDPEVATVNGATPAVIPNPKETSYYYVIAESKYGCFSINKSNVVTATVGSNPVVAEVVAPPLSVCSDQTISLVAGVQGDNSLISYYYEVTSASPLFSPISGTSTDGNINFSVNVENTITCNISVWAIFDGNCRSLNNLTYDVDVRGFPTSGFSQFKSNVCANTPFTFSLKGVTSHDLVSCPDPANAKLELVIKDKDGNVIGSQTGVSGSDFTVVVDAGLNRALLPLHYEFYDISSKWTDSNCPTVRSLPVTIVDLPEFNLVNNDGKADQTPDSDIMTLDYCVDESLNLALENPLPTLDPDNNPISYTYQWQYNGVDIVGEVAPEFHKANLIAANSGEYKLVVKTTTAECAFERIVNVTVHDLPAPIILPGNSLDTYCTDGYLHLTTEDIYEHYRWVIKGTSKIEAFTHSPNPDLIFKVSDIPLPPNSQLVDVELYATDKYGCVTRFPDDHSALLANPPVIVNVTGTETCTDNPFTFKVLTESKKYSINLYDAAGIEQVLNTKISVIDTTFTTAADMPEGDYTIVLTDKQTGCSSDSTVHFSRYDIGISYDLPNGKYFCENEGVLINVELFDKNGHADFFDKLDLANFSYTFTNDALGYAINMPDIAITSPTSGVISFDPRSLNPQMTPSSQSPYKLSGLFKYNFKNAVNTALQCSTGADEATYEIYILPIPELISTPEMPVCLRTDFEFSVKLDNVDPDWPQHKYVFFVNGVQVVNADGDYSSNVFKTADHPEITLAEGDQITAEVIMNDNGSTCVSAPLIVTYKPDFKPEITNVDLVKEHCKGADIEFTVHSILPDGVDPSKPLVNIKSLELYLIDNGVDTLIQTIDNIDALSTDGSFVYDGDSKTISFYAIVTDANDCVEKSNVVTVKINQFKVVDVVVTNEAGEVMNTNDLCADIDYTYKAVIQDIDGTPVTPGSDYDFTFTIDGVEWSDHSLGNYTLDYVTKPHAVTSGEVDLVVNVKNLLTGCVTDDALTFYPPYAEPFSYHAKPAPNERLKDALLPVTDDIADTAKFEVCYNDDFGFDVNGSIVTVVYDNVKVATYRDGAVDVIHNETTLSTSQITSSFEAGKSVFLFNITPSDNFHTLSFIVSDGTCEVQTEDWQFRMYEDVNIQVLDNGVDILADGVATICELQTISIVASTTEPTYASTKGFNFETNGVPILPDDFSQFSVLWSQTKGDYEVVVRPDFGRNGCFKSITLRVLESPRPAITLGDEEDTPLTPDSDTPLTYSFCENDNHILHLRGADSYELVSADRDGEDARSSFSLAAEDMVISLPYVPNSNSSEFSTYTLNYRFSVGTCDEDMSVVLKVYNKPEAEFINGTPKSLVISGTQVPVDVTPGYARYEFYINDVLVQDGTESLLPGDMNIAVAGTTQIKVVIHNNFGCTQVLEAQTQVLDGIIGKTITASSDFYCTDEPGVTISVVDPQVGITYFVDGVPSLAPIKATEGNPVEWSPVRLTNPSTVNPETFTVKGYYDEIPDQVFDMLNTVEVEEVKSPSDQTSITDLRVIDCSIAQSSSFTWTISNSETDKYYTLINVTEGNTPVSTPVTGTGANLVFNINELMTNAYGAPKNGDYQILVQSQRLNGDFVCDKTLDGILTLDLPTTNAYNLSIAPSSASVCVDNQNFKITLENSDYDAEYAHEYILFRDGVEVARVPSTPAAGEIVFDDPDRGTLAAGTYTYSVVCSFSGCLQPMANNVSLTVFDKPNIFNVKAQNDGYYCYDDPAGVTITVDGSQEGLNYQLIDLAHNTVIASVIAPAGGLPIEFANILKGDYVVQVVVPNVDNDGCATLLNSVKVIEVAEPKDFKTTITEVGSIGKGGHTLVICRGNEYQINVSGADFDPTGVNIRSYELRDSDGNLISTDMDGCGAPDEVNGTFCFPVMTATTPGTYTFDIVAKSTINLSDGTAKECEKLFVGVVELVVKDYAKTTESITVDLNPHPEIDCYGSDIIVNGANLTVTDSVEYRLYKVDDYGQYDVNKPIYIIKPYDGDPNIFENIKDAYGKYAIHANNGACDALVDIVLVENPRFALMQELDIDEFVCEGDGGVHAKMKDSEKDVKYSLYFISPDLYSTINPDNRILSPTDLSENLWGVMLGEVIATFDHERLTFNDLDYGDGNLTPVIYHEGYYYVVAEKVGVPNPCPTASPLLQFEILDLPKSFDLKESNLFCDAAGSSEVYIEQTEYDPEAVITYSLWKLSEFGKATFYDEIESNPDTDKPLYFKRKVEAGTYYAIVTKKYADKYNNKICTSRMRNYITVAYASPLDGLVFPTETITACAYDSPTYTLDRDNLDNVFSAAQATQPAITGIKFYLTELDQSPDGNTILDQKLYTGNEDVTFSGIPTGTHTIWASWASAEPKDEFACLIKLGDVEVNMSTYIPTNAFTETVCGTSFTVAPAYYIENLKYKLVDSDGNEIQTIVYDGVRVTDVTFDNLAPLSQYTIKASFQSGDACEVTMGSLNVRGITPATENHEITLCANESATYELPGELLLDGAYYYLTDKGVSPTEASNEAIRYHVGSDTPEFTQLCDGVNVIWAAFNGFDCLTAIDTITVMRYPQLPANIINDVVCGMTYEIDDPAMLFDGAEYTLVNQVEAIYFSNIYIEGATSVQLTAPSAGTYDIYVNAGSCESRLGVITFRDAIDTSNRINATITVCGGAPVSFTLTDNQYVGNLVEGLTYYIVEENETPSGIFTTGRKYVAGNDITFRGLLPGNYKVWASYDSYSCEVEIGDIHINDAEYEQLELMGIISCENDFTLSTDTSYVGVSYTVYGIAKDKSVTFTSSTLEGTGASLVWNYPYPDDVNRYELRAKAGECDETVVSTLYSGNISQDFDLIVANFYSQGGECNSTAPLSLVLDTSIVGIKYYLTLGDSDPREPLAGTLKDGDGKKLVWDVKNLGLSGRQTFHLYAYKGDLQTTGCFSDNAWRSININLDAVTYQPGHLVSRNDVLDYCAGETGIRLGYIDSPRKGEIYRLYRKDTESIWGRELIDMQEIPSYMDPSPIQPTDTLFFNGWGYNESSKEYATAGTYFVEVESEQGCIASTDTVVVVENPLPVEQTDSVFFVLIDSDGAVDMTTSNTEFGVMGGSLVYSKAVPGKAYTLLKDGVPISQTRVIPDVAKDLLFGPIQEMLSDTITVNDTVKVVDYTAIDDLGIHYGEGVYSVLVEDVVTNCTSELGNVTFVAEALTAYNVYIYLNKNEMARTVDLIPVYDPATDIAYKGNHMYIDWSSRVDRIYYPAITIADDGYYINDTEVTATYNLNDNPNYFTKGYTNIRGSYDQLRHKFTGKQGSSNVWFEIVNDPDKKISGTYGFIDVDATSNDTSHVKMSTQTGYFFYMKQPSFYGREEIQYQVANRQLANRVSNIATITILCGNEDTGDNESVFLIPNAFSPNGDGLNDLFKIIIPDRYQANSESKLEVFNRWGTLVYRSSGLRYGEDDLWWDGTSSTSNMVTLGENLPSGTYYYVFSITFIDKQHATRSERKMHGYVELRR